MFERVKFLADYESQEWTVSHLCREYGISRKTAYKWIKRYEQEGAAGLEQRSCTALSHPNQLDACIEQQILDARAKHSTWGPVKLVAWLKAKHPHLPLCAPSTAGNVLRRHGLSVARRPRSRATPSSQPLCEGLQPNQLWCADFKGWFRCGDGAKCYALTISDACSRFLIRCQVLPHKTDYEAVWPVFEAAFRQFGVPERMRTDNGPPFASIGLGGLSRLSVWWMIHGIKVERIEPGRPDQNGRHERMHLTLKNDTAQPPASCLRAQQRRFDQWREQYNCERPHAALGLVTPASLYQPSGRRWKSHPEAWDYGDEFDELRAVRDAGQIKWQGVNIGISQALAGQQIGLKRLDGRYWRLYFRDQFLGLLDVEEKCVIRPGKKTRRLLGGEQS